MDDARRDIVQSSADQIEEFTMNQVWREMVDGLEKRKSGLMAAILDPTKLIDEVNLLRGEIIGLTHVIDFPNKMLLVVRDTRKIEEERNAGE